MKSITLLPDVQLTAVQTEQFKTDLLCVSFCWELSSETNTQTALLSRVLKGCGGSLGNREALNRRLSELYGAELFGYVQKKGDVQVMGLGLQTVANQYALAGENLQQESMSLLLDVLLAPLSKGFDPAIVSLEKENLKKAIESLLNDKKTYGVMRCTEFMFAGQRYALSEFGDLSKVDAITPQALLDCWQKLLRIGRIELFYMGRASFEQVAEPLKKSFSALRREPVAAEAVSKAVARDAVQTVPEQMEVAQCKLTMGLTTGITGNEDQFPALMVANAVFGGGPTSKLFMNVREKLSLCYYAASRLEKHKGIMMVYAGVEQDKLEPAIQEIEKQLKSTQAGEISDEEFLAAKKLLTHALRATADSPTQTLDFLLGEALCHTGRSIPDLIEAIMRVTPQQAVDAIAVTRIDTIHILQPEEVAQ